MPGGSLNIQRGKDGSRLITGYWCVDWWNPVASDLKEACCFRRKRSKTRQSKPDPWEHCCRLWASFFPAQKQATWSFCCFYLNCGNCGRDWAASEASGKLWKRPHPFPDGSCYCFLHWGLMVPCSHRSVSVRVCGGFPWKEPHSDFSDYPVQCECTSRHRALTLRVLKNNFKMFMSNFTMEEMGTHKIIMPLLAQP